jgi:hypothetical protein
VTLSVFWFRGYRRAKRQIVEQVKSRQTAKTFSIIALATLSCSAAFAERTDIGGYFSVDIRRTSISKRSLASLAS